MSSEQVYRVRELEKECSDLRDQITLNDRLGALRDGSESQDRAVSFAAFAIVCAIFLPVLALSIGLSVRVFLWVSGI